jgi:hypothetical protein
MKMSGNQPVCIATSPIALLPSVDTTSENVSRAKVRIEQQKESLTPILMVQADIDNMDDLFDPGMKNFLTVTVERITERTGARYQDGLAMRAVEQIKFVPSHMLREKEMSFEALIIANKKIESGLRSHIETLEKRICVLQNEFNLPE